MHQVDWWCTVRGRQFNVSQVFLGMSKSDCWMTLWVTMFCPSGFYAIQSLYHLVSPVAFSSNDPFSVTQGGLRDLRGLREVVVPLKFP